MKKLQEKINKLEEEREVMSMKDFGALLKHVNIEDDKAIKDKMLNIIEMYFQKTGHIQTTVVEKVVEKVVETPKAQEEVEVSTVVEKTEDVPTTVVETVSEVQAVEKVEEVEVTDKVKEEAVEEVQSTTVVEEVPSAAEKVPEEVQPEAVGAVEEAVAKVAEDESTTESATYVENFSLVAPTTEDHLEQLKENGGYIFKMKRTTMLGLCVDDIWIALAKTQKLEEFPEEVREHIKAGEFVSVKIHNVGEIVKKSRQRLTDIEFSGFELLPTDHPVKVTVTNLLEHGIVPEKYQDDEPKAEEKVESADPVVEEQKETVQTVPHTIELKAQFVSGFVKNRHMALTNGFPLTVVNGEGTLKYVHEKGVLPIGTTKSSLENGEYVIGFADYTLEDNVMNAEVVVRERKELAVAAPTQETKQEVVKEEVKAEIPAEEPAPAKEEAPTPVRSEEVKVRLPEGTAVDFPNSNKLTVELVDLGAQRLDRKTVLANEKNVIPFIARDNKMHLVSSQFITGTVITPLTVSGTLPDMKFMIRVKDVQIEDKDGKTFLHYTFDQLAEVEKYIDEKVVYQVNDFILLNEENLAMVQQQVDKARAAKAAKEVLEKKDLNKEQIDKLTNPRGRVENLGESVEQVAPKKDVSESIKALKENNNFTKDTVAKTISSASGALTTMVAEASTKTKVQMDNQDKQTTTVTGNLKEGVGQLSETETVVEFKTPFKVEQWKGSAGRIVTIESKFAKNIGQAVTSKLISIIGSNGKILGQGQARIEEAVFLDGNRHKAEILKIEGAKPTQDGSLITLRLGNFTKESVS